MANRIISRELDDWSQISRKDSFFLGMDISREENFGIHVYNGTWWTSGFVGVGRLYGTNGRPLTTQGKEHVIVINSQYHMEPWKMLEKVMTDDEYDDYLAELKEDGKYLFKIFYDQPMIKLTQDQRCDADILYALSFINSCYSLCRKGIKKKMLYQEENFTSKVRGKIDIPKNIRRNTCKGRNDRFYCKYIDFTADTIENRILKATLVRCKKTIEQKFEMHSEIIGRLSYCMNTLRSVKLVTIRNRDFNGVAVSGLYSYYKPLMKQAKCILGQKYLSYIAEDGKTVSRSVYTIPYMINMETVFEFYVRSVLRDVIDKNRYYLEKYSKRVFLENNVTCVEDALQGIHLMKYCIPDVIICDKATQKPVVVLDAKYKAHDKSVRTDSHQLLSYCLLTGVEKCGFVFPGAVTELKSMRGKEYLEVTTPLMHQLKYYELILGNAVNATEVQKILLESERV